MSGDPDQFLGGRFYCNDVHNNKKMYFSSSLDRHLYIISIAENQYLGNSWISIERYVYAAHKIVLIQSG